MSCQEQKKQPSFPALAFIGENGDAIQGWSKSLGPQGRFCSVLEIPRPTPMVSLLSKLYAMCSEHLLYAYDQCSFLFLSNRNSIFHWGTPPLLFQAFLVGLTALGLLPHLRPQRMGTGPRGLPSKSLMGNLFLRWSCY